MAAMRLGTSLRHTGLMGEGGWLGGLGDLPSPVQLLFSRKYSNLVLAVQDLYTVFAKDLGRCYGTFKVTCRWWDAQTLGFSQP